MMIRFRDLPIGARFSFSPLSEGESGNCVKRDLRRYTLHGHWYTTHGNAEVFVGEEILA